MSPIDPGSDSVADPTGTVKGGPVDGPPNGVDDLVTHLKDCRKVDAAIVQDGNADDLVTLLIGQGWRYEGTEYVAGKRVRYLVPPEGLDLSSDSVADPTGAVKGGAE